MIAVSKNLISMAVPHHVKLNGANCASLVLSIYVCVYYRPHVCRPKFIGTIKHLSSHLERTIQ